MSMTFEHGKDFWSEMYGASYRCLRRWHEGTLELVELAQVLQDGRLGPRFVRTARAMQPGFKVKEVRGGVTDAKLCTHDDGWISTKTYGDICPLCGVERS